MYGAPPSEERKPALLEIREVCGFCSFEGRREGAEGQGRKEERKARLGPEAEMR